MFHERLKLARIKKKITQQELAVMVNTTKASISNYENNRSSPSFEMLIKLADSLECSTDFLIGRTHLLEDVHINSIENSRYLDCSNLGDEDIEFIKISINFLRAKNMD